MDLCIISDVLEKWEVPPINEVNRKLERMERTIQKQEESIDELRYVCMYVCML